VEDVEFNMKYYRWYHGYIFNLWTAVEASDGSAFHQQIKLCERKHQVCPSTELDGKDVN
jgi:hypothetical protein